jgi:hypothetical protein
VRLETRHEGLAAIPGAGVRGQGRGGRTSAPALIVEKSVWRQGPSVAA